MSSWDSSLRLKKIDKILRQNYDFALKFDINKVEELQSLYEKYSKIKEEILLESGFNSYHSNTAYTKTMLILEAIRVFLSEIAPKRLNKKRNKISGME